ncbi:hypothetical protein [Mycolicibacterium sp. XJ1819]
MLDFICPTCGNLGFEEAVCATCSREAGVESDVRDPVSAEQ